MTNKERLELSERVKARVEHIRYPEEVAGAEIDRLFGSIVVEPFEVACLGCVRRDCVKTVCGEVLK